MALSSASRHFATTLPLLIHPIRDGKAAARAVAHFDLVLPRQPILAGDQIADIAVGAILRAAFDGDIAAMAELIDVVFHAPDPARLLGELRPPLGGDDLVGCAGAGHERHAVEIDDHPFAHGIDNAVGAGHAELA